MAYSKSSIFLLALSTMEVSSDARYICVVFSESCPIPSLITARYIAAFGDTCPRMARYIEYKNKTQEKCNYCTIYQCISGFYKKNVELHLLLILAIDSLIYSFYVTILLCKKAPVFD